MVLEVDACEGVVAVSLGPTVDPRQYRLTRRSNLSRHTTEGSTCRCSEKARAVVLERAKLLTYWVALHGRLAIMKTSANRREFAGLLVQVCLASPVDERLES